jgi:pimeloyl-ACP methyl ester carboxylesterase
MWSVVVFGAVLALPSSLKAHVQSVRTRPGQALAASKALGSVEERWFCDQLVDHASADETTETLPPTTAKYCQRYFIDSSHVQRDGARANTEVFLCVGGEGPALDETVLSGSAHCNDMVELGAKRGALLVALEHRYYGKSHPVPDLSTPNLRWLSSRQALADLARFVRDLLGKGEAGVTPASKVVTFGGSYPGMLAGWARLKYPDLIHAAVASSAPIFAQINFRGYNNVVFDSLANGLVGGSAACAATMATAHERIAEVLRSTPEARRHLEKTFGVCDGNLESADNQMLWAGMGVLPVDIQGNDPACTGDLCNIGKVCAALLNETGEPLAQLVGLARRFRAAEAAAACAPVDYEAQMTGPLQNTTLAGGEARVWIYQTCTEFGFYQTCEQGTSCPWAQGFNSLAYNLRVCEDAFGINAADVERAIAQTNEYYGGLAPRSSRVLYPNGEVDPWRASSLLVPRGPEVPTMFVPGASHHFWTHPSAASDPPEDVQAKAAIAAYVTAWLADGAAATPVAYV